MKLLSVEMACLLGVQNHIQAVCFHAEDAKKCVKIISKDLDYFFCIEFFKIAFHIFMLVNQNSISD